MSLKLDELEAKISDFIMTNEYRVLFHYPKSLVSLHREVKRLEQKLSSGSYGERTKQRAVQILNQYNLNVSTEFYPPDSGTLDDKLIWALEKSGFQEVSRSYGQLLSQYELIRAEDFAILRIMSLGLHTQIYLNEYGLLVKEEESERTIVRFYLSCIHPVLFHCPAPSLSTLPVEVLSNLATFLEIEDIGLFASVNRSIRSALNDDDSCWKFIYTNLSKYYAAETPSVEDPPIYKEALKDIITERQRRREEQFVRTIQVSDWAVPVRVVDPILEIRPRRIDVMDDLDLF